ncbi:MAG: hypothetical protein OXP70_16220 [Acidobacteriota bacterium]|nr:hypothetical protein [Acidobacteriota bacterium]
MPEVSRLRWISGSASLPAEALTYTADAHTESMAPEIDAAQTRPIVIDMRRVDQEWHAHLDQMELRPDPLAYDPWEGVRKLDKLIAQTWVLLALMGVALILELAILGLLLFR